MKRKPTFFVIAKKRIEDAMRDPEFKKNFYKAESLVEIEQLFIEWCKRQGLEVKEIEL